MKFKSFTYFLVVWGGIVLFHFLPLRNMNPQKRSTRCLSEEKYPLFVSNQALFRQVKIDLSKVIMKCNAKWWLYQLSSLIYITLCMHDSFFFFFFVTVYDKKSKSKWILILVRNIFFFSRVNITGSLLKLCESRPSEDAHIRTCICTEINACQMYIYIYLSGRCACLDQLIRYYTILLWFFLSFFHP